MERIILNISSCREFVTEKFSQMLRELGRRTKRPLWGKAFNPDEEAKALLYLDSGGRGSLPMMAKSMSADIIEYVFVDRNTGEHFLLLSEMLKEEYKNGELSYISLKEAGKTLGHRIKVIDTFYGIRDFFVVNSPSFRKSPVYSAFKSEVKKNIDNGCCNEGDMAMLFGTEDIPTVIICDAFSENGVYAFLEARFGNPRTVHIMNRSNHIYAPYMSLEKEIFIETEAFVKEALFAVGRWLSDLGEEKCGELLYASFESLSGSEELLERTCANFMSGTVRKKRAMIK